MDLKHVREESALTAQGDEWLPAPYLPVETSEVERAFPAHHQHLMPAPADIPDRYWERYATPFAELTTKWMRGKLEPDVSFAATEFLADQGDVKMTERAYWHLACIIGSYGPKHEHKEAAVSFLAELWFECIGADVTHPQFGTPIELDRTGEE